jgi:MoxR-like ATPase
MMDQIYLDDRVRDFIVDLVMVTRNPAAHSKELAAWIHFGASPRATINLTLVAKAQAFLEGRGYVTPSDVVRNAASVLRHRIILTYEAEAQEKSADDVVQRILDLVPVP